MRVVVIDDSFATTFTTTHAVARNLAPTKKPPVSQGLLRSHALVGALVLREA